MCTTTNCENGFVSEPKSHAHAREKSTLSGGGLDPSLLRWLPPVAVEEAGKKKRLASKETVWLKCCLPLRRTQAKPRARASTAGQQKATMFGSC